MVRQYMKHSDGRSKSFISFVKEKEEDADKMQFEEGKSGAKRRRSDKVSNERVHEDETLDGYDRGAYTEYEG